MTTLLGLVLWLVALALVMGTSLAITLLEWRPGPRDYRCAHCRRHLPNPAQLDTHETGCPLNPMNQAATAPRAKDRQA